MNGIGTDQPVNENTSVLMDTDQRPGRLEDQYHNGFH